MMFNACLVARSLGEYEELGQRSAELLAEVSATDPSGEEHARALKVRSSYFLWRKEFGNSLECVNQAIAILERLGYERDLAGALIDRAALFSETEHFTERDRDLERAREIAVRLQDYFRVALILVNKARFLLAEGKLKETLDAAQQAEQAARRADSANMLGQAQDMRALACQALGRESEATALWQQTLELIQHYTPGPVTRGVLVRCADSLLRQGRREQASRLYQQACLLQHIVIENEDVARLFTTLQSTFSR
jgi:tetratricopeptide (TPR) repeat protein